MPKKWTPAQLRKIEAGKRYIKTSIDADSLYMLVVIASPSVISKITDSNTDTVWSRVENPGIIKVEDLESYAAAFDVTAEEFLRVVQRQMKYNKEETLHKRPIGRAKFDNSKEDQE